MGATGLGAGAIENTANQVIRNDGFNNFSIKELAVSSVGTGFGFTAGGTVSGIATKATSQMTSQALQRTIQGATIGSTAGTAGAFTGNITDQTWDIVASGAKTTFDTRSLIRDTSMGLFSGLGIGAGLGYFGPKFFQANKKQVPKSNKPGVSEVKLLPEARTFLATRRSQGVVSGGRLQST